MLRLAKDMPAMLKVEPAIDPARRAGLTDALCDAVGSPAVGEALENVHGTRSIDYVGWPWGRWAARFRGDPLKHLKLGDVKEEIRSLVSDSVRRPARRGRQRRPGPVGRPDPGHARTVAGLRPRRGPLPLGPAPEGADRRTGRDRAAAGPGAGVVASGQGVAVPPRAAVRGRSRGDRGDRGLRGARSRRTSCRAAGGRGGAAVGAADDGQRARGGAPVRRSPAATSW